MNTDTLFSSKSNEWETPDDLFKRLDAVFHFTLDAAATKDNAKCKKFYTIENDGLSKDWKGESVFCNPPYGRELGKWIQKCALEGEKNDTHVVMLAPSRTDTIAMQDYCFTYAMAVCFIKGRLHFKNRMLPSYREDGNFKVSSAPFPSLIAVFGRPKPDQIHLLEQIGCTFLTKG